MNGDVAIEVDRAPAALTIPINATRQRDDKTYVDVRTGEKTYQEREITVGLESDDKVQVLSGLNESDEILLPE
jgi:multidrug efflux pump subunit AcrA (membrane-fusion protein)